MDPLVEFLASDLHAGGHRLPCGVLRGVLLRGSFRGRPARETLLLAAFTRNTLAALSADLEAVVSEGPRQGELYPDAVFERYPYRSMETGTRLGDDIPLLTIRAGAQPVLPAQTYALLGQLPRSLVEQILAWAPPVIAIGDDDSTAIPGALYGNFAAALLARVACPLEEVYVRIVTGAQMIPQPARPESPELPGLRALVRRWLPRLMAVCQGYKPSLAVLADGVLAGQWETRLKRAMTYRYRQRARAAGYGS